MKNILEAIRLFSNKKITVLGDTVLDMYLYGSSWRLCPDAPVPVVDIEKEEYMGGAAANTVFNLNALKADTRIVSVIGDDEEGKLLKKLFKGKNIDTTYLLKNKYRKTLTKKRVSSNDQLIARIDSGTVDDISSDLEEKIMQILSEIYNDTDVFIISDYGKGTITENIISFLRKLSKKTNKLTVVDSKYLDKFREIHPTVVKPNFEQAANLLGITKPAYNGERASQIEKNREKLLEITGSNIAVVTLGNEGALLIQKNKETYRTFAHSILHSKTSGAGDTFISAFTLALSCGIDPKQAAEIASAAADIVIRKEGTSICSQSELIAFFSKTDKYATRDDIVHIVDVLRKDRRKIVFTNGCFDILHSGHVDFLNRAKTLGDILVVGINSDESIKKLKGSDRPINTLKDRINVLSGLSSVDYIVPFTEITPINLIKHIKPDIHVKGGDYRKENLPETPVVQKYGGDVVILPYISNYSTTQIIKKVYQKFNGFQYAQHLQ